VFVLAIPLPSLRIVPYLMFGGTFLVALSYMLQARLEPKFDTILARLLVTFLAFVQPLGRGWARYFTWLKFKRTPRSVIAAPEANLAPSAKRRGSAAKLNFWSETGAGREKLLAEIFSLLETEGWSYSSDTGWKEWDIQIYGNFWWITTLQTVTEYHGGPKCLTRVKLGHKMVVTTFLVNFPIVCLLFFRTVFMGSRDVVWVALYAIFVFVLLWRAYRLKARLADLVAAAATRCGLQPLHGKAKAAASAL